MEQTVKDIRSLRLFAFILGIIGGLSLIFSLLTDSYEIATVVGSIGINSSATVYLSSFYFLVIALSACGIIFTIMHVGIADIITGVLCILPSLYLYIDIRSKSDYRSVAVHVGPMFYLMFIGGIMILVSGIVTKLSQIKAKENGLEEDKVKSIKYSKLAYSLLALICATCIALTSVSLFIENKNKNEASNTVTGFLSACINCDYDEIISFTDPEVNDKNGLMEAYTPGCIGGVYLSVLGLKYDELSPEYQTYITEMEEYFAKSYLKSCKISDVKVIGDEYIVTVDAKILKFKDGDSDTATQEFGQRIASEYMNGKTNMTTKDLFERILPELIDYMNDSITDADVLDTEITFNVQKKDGKFVITEIDYQD